MLYDIFYVGCRVQLYCLINNKTNQLNIIKCCRIKTKGFTLETPRWIFKDGYFVLRHQFFSVLHLAYKPQDAAFFSCFQHICAASGPGSSSREQSSFRARIWAWIWRPLRYISLLLLFTSLSNFRNKNESFFIHFIILFWILKEMVS